MNHLSPRLEPVRDAKSIARAHACYIAGCMLLPGTHTKRVNGGNDTVDDSLASSVVFTRLPWGEVFGREGRGCAGASMAPTGTCLAYLLDVPDTHIPCQAFTGGGAASAGGRGQASAPGAKRKPGRPPRDVLAACQSLIEGFKESLKTDAKYWGEEAATFLRNTKNLLKDLNTRLPGMQVEEKEKKDTVEASRKAVEAIVNICELVSKLGWVNQEAFLECFDRQEQFLSMPPKVTDLLASILAHVLP